MRMAVGVKRSFRGRILVGDHSLRYLTKRLLRSSASNIRVDRRTPASPCQPGCQELVTGNDLPETLLALHLVEEILFQTHWKLRCLSALCASHRNLPLAHSTGRQ